MVEVVSYYPQQINMLEWLLITNHIKYQVNVPSYTGFEHMSTPYLIVDGVPLDEDRAVKWIKEKRNGEDSK